MPRIVVAALAPTILLTVMVEACGGADKSTVQAARVASSSTVGPTTTLSTTSPTPRHLNNDGDNNEDDNGNGIRLYGHAASTADNRAITALVKRYYAEGVAGDGGAACRLLSPPLAKAAPEDYGRSPGPPYLRGSKTCGAIVSRVFKHNRSQFAGGIRMLKVTGVRVEGDRGYALLLFKTLVDERQIIVQRERGMWKIGAVVDRELP